MICTFVYMQISAILYTLIGIYLPFPPKCVQFILSNPTVQKIVIKLLHVVKNVENIFYIQALQSICWLIKLSLQL